MRKLEKYLNEVKASVEASYTIGTQAPAFRQDVEVLLEIVKELVFQRDMWAEAQRKNIECRNVEDNSFKNEIWEKEVYHPFLNQDNDKLESLIPTKEGDE